MLHSSGGASSHTVPLSTRPEMACSSVALVAKGHTGALFLLIVIFGAALAKGLGDMWWFCKVDLKVGRSGGDYGGAAS